MDCFQLKKGEVKYVQILGEHLAVFRGHSGKANILDAYCPHLGANLATHGKVVGENCIECPFHGWRFEGESGKCASIPYCDKVPEIARTTVWPVLETNNMIHVYYNADKEEHTWTPPDLQLINSNQYIFHGRFECHIRSHIQEIPENGSDIAHLGYLHEKFIIPGLPLLQHEWIPIWEPGT